MKTIACHGTRYPIMSRLFNFCPRDVTRYSLPTQTMNAQSPSDPDGSVCRATLVPHSLQTMDILTFFLVGILY